MSRKSEQKHTIVFEVPPSKDGHYQRVDEHGRVIHGDASGEWTEDDEIVFFASPSFLRELGRKQ